MMDFFRKIPADLTETTVTGAALSVAACLFMGVLFVVELYAFLSTTVETGVMLDTNTDTLLRINFNVTMLDLQCEYAAVDVVDVLGTNSMNVTKNVEKWQLDEHGKRMIFQGRNREQKAISYEEHHPDTVEEMIANGIHVRRRVRGRFMTTASTPSPGEEAAAAFFSRFEPFSHRPKLWPKIASTST